MILKRYAGKTALYNTYLTRKHFTMRTARISAVLFTNSCVNFTYNLVFCVLSHFCLKTYSFPPFIISFKFTLNPLDTAYLITLYSFILFSLVHFNANFGVFNSLSTKNCVRKGTKKDPHITKSEIEKGLLVNSWIYKVYFVFVDEKENPLAGSVMKRVFSCLLYCCIFNFARVKLFNQEKTFKKQEKKYPK